MRKSKIAERYETRWKHTEMQKEVERKLNRNLVDLSTISKIRKVQSMELPGKWDLEDLNKLKSNRHRPIQELKLIFRGRYSEDQLRDALVAIKSDIKKNNLKPRKARLSADEFKILYENHQMTNSAFIERYPEFLKKLSDKTIGWYISCIRAEVKGIRTSLPDEFYADLRKYYNNTHPIQLPERGSAGIRRDTKLKLDKKEKKTENKPATPVENATENSVKAEVKDVQNTTPAVPPVSSVPSGESRDYTITLESGFLKFGLSVGNEIKIVADSLAQIEGAEMVYRQFGFNDARKVKLLVEEFS